MQPTERPRARDVDLLRWLDGAAIGISVAGAVAAGALLATWFYDLYSVAWICLLAATWLLICAHYVLAVWQRRVRNRLAVGMFQDFPNRASD